MGHDRGDDDIERTMATALVVPTPRSSRPQAARNQPSDYAEEGRHPCPGNLSVKHGGITVPSTGASKLFFIDSNLPLNGEPSVVRSFAAVNAPALYAHPSHLVFITSSYQSGRFHRRTYKSYTSSHPVGGSIPV
jgi:hypothetical protein